MLVGVVPTQVPTIPDTPPPSQPAGLNTDEDFIKKVPVIREITNLVDIVDKGMFGVNPRKFPPKNKYLTGVYSRDREYL